MRGLVVLVPVTVTVAIVYWLFAKVDGIFSPYIQSIGLGALLVVSLVFTVGWISLFPTSKRVFGHVNVWLEQAPGVSFIYTSARDFLEAFAGNKRRFTHAVLVNVHSEEVWLVGFLTDEDLSGFKLGVKYVAVYVPQAYNVAGQLYLVKREHIRPIEHLAPADVMKYAVTGGAVELITGATSAKAKAEEKAEAEVEPEVEPTARPAAT
ncbi:MAG: DUF502 domain-containing protein [Undibacterium sp.]|nr:DUF502 domain-containing protein [Opitutaceae bacterium]